MAGHKKAQWRRADNLQARTKSSPQQTRRPRLLYTTSIVFKTLYTDRRRKREQSHEDPFKHPGD